MCFSPFLAYFSCLVFPPPLACQLFIADNTVQQHLGENVVRTIAMDGRFSLQPLTPVLKNSTEISLVDSGTEGLVRGAPVTDTGAPIMIPVGPGTLGRIMNVTGDPIDERGPIKHTMKAPIHAEAPEYVEQATSAEVLVTGIKVVDLLAPYARGGKIGLFGGAGVGKTVFIQELIVSSSPHTRLMEKETKFFGSGHFF